MRSLLVSNLKQRRSGSIEIVDDNFALGFNTDSDKNGFDVKSVLIEVDSPPPPSSNLKVSIWTSTEERDPTSPRPRASMVVLSNPRAITEGLNAFRSNPTTQLEPDTTYFVVVSSGGDDMATNPSMITTRSNDEDRLVDQSGTIWNDLLMRSVSMDGEWDDSSETIADQVRFAVQGTARTLPIERNYDPRGRILRIEPEITAITVGPGDSVQLGVRFYGRQGIRDETLADEAPLWWRESQNTGSISEASGQNSNGYPDDEQVDYAAPTIPGIYRVTAYASGCLANVGAETLEEVDARCSAEFTVQVMRGRDASELAEDDPRNPSGLLPVVIPGADGVQHAVFTPAEGGEVSDGTCSFAADPGTVPDLEIVGVAVETVSADGGNDFDDFRFISRGEQCRISAVDSSGARINTYDLRKAGEICMPMPVEFRSRLVDANVAVVESGAVKRLLGSVVRLSGSGDDLSICGRLGELPGDVAVVVRMSAGETIPPEVLDPIATPTAPETGAGPSHSFAAFILLGILGIAIVAFVLAVVRPSRGSTQGT